MGQSNLSTQANSRQKTLTHGKGFSEGLLALLDELQLAIKWHRPSILLVVHKTKLGQIKAENALKTKLEKFSQKVICFQVNNNQSDVIRLILDTQNYGDVVFFITDIGHGAGADGNDAYRALNLYRESLVEKRIRAVFWLTEKEASNLPHFAPDFWAFRHRVIEFASSRASKNDPLPSGVLIWHNKDTLRGKDTLDDQIHFYEQLLANLPAEDGSLTMRIESLYKLAFCYWNMGDNEKSKATLTFGLHLGHRLQDPNTDIKFLNGLAILNYEGRNFDETLTIYKKALELKISDSSLLINLGITYHALNQNRKAISIGRRAAIIDPKNPRLWINLGYLYFSMKKFDDAIFSVEKAIEINPKALDYRDTLAIFFCKTGELDKSKQQIKIARNITSDYGLYHRLCEEAINGNKEGAAKLLDLAIGQKELTRTFVSRDPNINLILDLK
ncbi:MAG TPA: tetratricopeptide repeat protein [Flavobacterium sp.]|nr:tetratricopeptide repeat protein [Flavobacterium sp.]